MYNFRKTGNTKLGNIPVTRSPQQNCPDTCSLKNNGCYAELSWLGVAWKKDIDKGISFNELIKNIKSIKKGKLWRHNEAGDISHINGNIIEAELNEIILANKGKQGFTYTHHKPNQHNSPLIKNSNDNGFTINLSAENNNMVDEYISLGIGPVVTILPIDSKKVTYTKNGNKIVRCPNTNNSTIKCEDCKLCYIADRKYVIGFPAHGVRKNKVEKIAIQNIGD